MVSSVEERFDLQNSYLKTHSVHSSDDCEAAGLWKAPHYRQRTTWDCGVACVQMILAGLRCNCDREQLLRSLATSSIWTIDLALLLHECGVRFEFCTKTVGCKAAYRSIDFYHKAFEQDADRVNRRFFEANAQGIGVRIASFSITELAQLVQSASCAVMVLVDARHLPYHQAHVQQHCSGSPTAADTSSYKGHYLLLVGYLIDPGVFVVRDPAVDTEALLLSHAVIDAARLSYGTDEDVLILDLAKSEQHTKQQQQQQQQQTTVADSGSATSPTASSVDLLPQSPTGLSSLSPDIAAVLAHHHSSSIIDFSDRLAAMRSSSDTDDNSVLPPHLRVRKWADTVLTGLRDAACNLYNSSRSDCSSY
jgi:Guanylylate cyclase